MHWIVSAYKSCKWPCRTAALCKLDKHVCERGLGVSWWVTVFACVTEHVFVRRWVERGLGWVDVSGWGWARPMHHKIRSAMKDPKWPVAPGSHQPYGWRPTVAPQEMASFRGSCLGHCHYISSCVCARVRVSALGVQPWLTSNMLFALQLWRSNVKVTFRSWFYILTWLCKLKKAGWLKEN